MESVGAGETVLRLLFCHSRVVIAGVAVAGMDVTRCELVDADGRSSTP